MRVEARLAFGLLVFAMAAACGPASNSNSTTDSNGKPLPLNDTCKIQLPPRPSPLEATQPGPPPKPSTHPSRMIAHVEMKLASLAKELEAKISPRVADERNRDIGVAGHLNYTVDRGPFTVAIENDSLVVRTDLHAHAEACRGKDCYASCEPQGRATATVPLRLTPEYRFQPSHVAFAFTKGCEVRALGGLVRIDVTPTIQAQLQPSLHRVEHEIDGKLPPLRPQAERLWTELGKSRSIPLGGCVVTNPHGIVEGPVTGTADRVRVRFGLIAYPELRTKCGDAPPPPPGPLPPLAQDPQLPPEDDLVLGLVSPLSLSTSNLEGTPPFDVGNGARTRVAKTTTASNAAGLAQIDLGLRGDACGDVAIRSPLAWTEDGKQLRIAAPMIATPGEADRVKTATLSFDAFSGGLAALRFNAPVDPEALKNLVPTIASSMSDPTMDIAATVSSVKPLDVTLRGDDVVASVLVRGSVELKEK